MLHLNAPTPYVKKRWPLVKAGHVVVYNPHDRSKCSQLPEILGTVTKARVYNYSGYPTMIFVLSKSYWMITFFENVDPGVKVGSRVRVTVDGLSLKVEALNDTGTS